MTSAPPAVYYKHSKTGHSIFKKNGQYVRFVMVYPGWQIVPLDGPALIEAMNL